MTFFGTSVRNALAEARLTQSEVATSAKISQPYFNQMLTGLKRVSPRWVDTIADTLNLSLAKRRELHLAAAKDHGFKL
jgi:DNA-binding transcriptional regulator YdaS (Cro superfamily)